MSEAKCEKDDDRTDGKIIMTIIMMIMFPLVFSLPGNVYE